MKFNSIEFLLFLPIVFLLYWSLQRKKIAYQNVVVLAASYVFYAWWDWRFLGLIIFSTVIDYFAGIEIGKPTSDKRKRAFLILSLTINLGMLAFFKYFNFFIESFIDATNNIGFEMDQWSLNIVLPVGISFYTFQTLSYSIDIYKGNIKPTKDFIGFAAFVSFFPQLVAGPIERASNLLPQFFKKREFVYENALNGFTLMIYGFFKKVVIADRLAPYVNEVYNDIDSFNSLTLIVATVFFAIQIYCDFSGYSLIARGIAKLFGFDLMVNFNRPYLSKNFKEFWGRWHISLSSWFRDYLYIPLGGNRVKKTRVYINLMIVFLVSGLWHGANWTFVVWGALHGFYLILNQIFDKIKLPKNKYLIVLFVFILTCFAWIFFRANTISDAFLCIEKIIQFDLEMSELYTELGVFSFILSLISISLLILSYFINRKMKFKNIVMYYLVNTLLLTIIYLLGENGNATFIYFQF